MRLLLALLIAGAAAAPAAAAAPQLVGTDGKGPVTLLDADLQPVPGGPKLPRGTDGTVLSPNGKRVATWAFSPGTITVRDAGTGTAQRTLKSEPDPDVYWPTRSHVLTINFDADDGYAKTPILIRSYDLETGTAAVKRLPGHPIDTQRRGNVTRLLVAGGNDPSFPHGGFTVYDVGAGAKLKAATKLTLPEGMDTYAGTSLTGDAVFASEDGQSALVGLDGSTIPVALPKGYWSPLGDGFVTDNDQVATFDPRTGAVGPLVDVANTSLTPYEGGLIMGLGRARYDAQLNKVAENPAARDSGYFSVLVANDRLYAFTFNCNTDPESEGMAIVDAATGKPVRTVPGGRWKVGILGAGRLEAKAYDDDCD